MKEVYSRQGLSDSGPNPTRCYMNDLANKKPLSKEEEYQLFCDYFKNNDKKAYNKIVDGNLRLVVKVARTYNNRGMALLDMIEEGNLGLMHAIDKFDHERGFRFSTYATWWIRQNIERAIMNQTRQIRLPIHVIKRLTSYLNANKKMGKNEIEASSVEEIAKFFDKEVDEVQKILGYKLGTSSLDAQVFDDSCADIKGVIADPKSYNPEDIVGDESTGEILSDWVERLDELDHAVVVHRYGLKGHDAKTLEQVGEELGLTRERVRQIQMRALSRLRRFMNFSGISNNEIAMIDQDNEIV